MIFISHKVNISKTKNVVFTRARFHHLNLLHNLEIVKDYIYLGIHLSSTGSYLNTKKMNVRKVTKSIYEILKKDRVHNLSINCQYDLFDKMVKPILLYGMKYGFLVTMI